jgi:hypothetical protein
MSWFDHFACGWLTKNSTACSMLCILSASSSDISTLNSSSIAMTTSTVSRLSNPRSLNVDDVETCKAWTVHSVHKRGNGVRKCADIIVLIITCACFVDVIQCRTTSQQLMLVHGQKRHGRMSEAGNYLIRVHLFEVLHAGKDPFRDLVPVQVSAAEEASYRALQMRRLPRRRSNSTMR